MDASEKSYSRLCRIGDSTIDVDDSVIINESISVVGSTSRVPHIIVDEAPLCTDDSIPHMVLMVQEPTSKRCRIFPPSAGTVQGRCPVEPVLVTPTKHIEESISVVGSTSRAPHDIVDEAPVGTDDSISHMDSMVQEPTSKRCRTFPPCTETIQGRCPVEPVLVTPTKHSYASSISRTGAAPTDLEDEQIVELISVLLRKKGECVAKIIQQRVANGQGAFLFKKDQFIAVNLLEKALQQWRNSRAVAEHPVAKEAQDKAAASHAKSAACAQEEQSSCTSTCAETPVKMSYTGWKQCAKLVECGIARDMISAAQAIQDARGNPELAATMLLSSRWDK